ncbi:hypothetical protein AB0E69_33935 [Kribbella sp. NPDC026611]|uniref:hypothetical protein n=1 Tax=Kribbella sp. NPDC026611 TaxID=3154911 RepID=UPI0033F4C2BE
MTATSLISAGTASAQTPPINEWSRHCVSDSSDSYIGLRAGSGGSVFLTSRNFQATACEYRYHNYMQVGLSWKYLRIERPAGLLGGTAFFFKVWDCATNKVAGYGVKNYAAHGMRLYGTSGTAQTSTFTVKSGHKYKVQVTGVANYLYNNLIWRFAEYPPRGVGALSAYSACYAS